MEILANIPVNIILLKLIVVVGMNSQKRTHAGIKMVGTAVVAEFIIMRHTGLKTRRNYVGFNQKLLV